MTPTLFTTKECQVFPQCTYESGNLNRQNDCWR